DKLLSVKDLSIGQVLNMISGGITYLQSLQGISVLNQKLPLVNKSVNDLMSYVQVLIDGVNQFQSNPGGALQQVESRLESALGIDPSLLTLSFGFDQNTGAINALNVDFDL